MKKSCINCKWLYIKDFIYGICDCPDSEKTIVKPNSTCKYFVQKEKQKR